MRITEALWKHKIEYNFVFKKIFKRRSQLISLEPISLPPKVDGSRIEVETINEFLYPKPTPPEKFVPFHDPSILHPEWQEKPAHFFYNKSRLVEGHKQMANLIKTVVYDSSLPPALQTLAEDMAPHENKIRDLVQDAWIRNGRQDRMPKEIDVHHPHIYKPKSFSVPLPYQITQLAWSLINLYNQNLVLRDPTAFLNRSLINKAFTRILVPREDHLLGIAMSQDFLLTCKDPLLPVASPDEVRATEGQALEDIYPLLPTLDLEPCHHYTTAEIDWYDDHQTINFPHTSFLVHKSVKWFFPSMRVARSMATCFANAATLARRLYGKDVKQLPEPIVTQCVHFDVHGLYLVVYQLNTLDLTEQGGVKNQAWVESTGPLFSSALWYEGLQDFDASPVSRMTALLNHGLN